MDRKSTRSTAAAKAQPEKMRREHGGGIGMYFGPSVGHVRISGTSATPKENFKDFVLFFFWLVPMVLLRFVSGIQGSWTIGR